MPIAESQSPNFPELINASEKLGLTFEVGVSIILSETRYIWN